MHPDLVDGLFVRYRDPIYRFLRRLLRDGSAAEDLTQDTFVRALNGRYHPNGHERAWIFQIARNLARDHARAPRRGAAGVRGRLDAPCERQRHVASGVGTTRARPLRRPAAHRRSAARGRRGVDVPDGIDRGRRRAGHARKRGGGRRPDSLRPVAPAHGARRTDPVALDRHHGTAGVDVPFGFPALRFPVPQLAADQYPFDVTARVDGHLRGRTHPDGTIGVELRAHRWNGLERRSTDQAGMAGSGQGRKFLRLVPGEAIEIELPAGVGMSSMPAMPGAPGVSFDGLAAQPGGVPGFEPFRLRDGELTVFFEPFFQGHTVSLLLQARPVDQ